MFDRALASSYAGIVGFVPHDSGAQTGWLFIVDIRNNQTFYQPGVARILRKSSSSCCYDCVATDISEH